MGSSHLPCPPSKRGQGVRIHLATLINAPVERVFDLARNITLREIVLAIVAVYTISIVVEGICRVWFHPLSKYPGPRLAALTLWWQCYYDVFLNSGGQLLAHLKPLHEKYGMCLYILSE